MKPTPFGRATTNAGVITSFPSRPRMPRASKNPLMPAIPLYRLLLRTHRTHLPPALRVLGDKYIKSEFRLHRASDNASHVIGFLSEWQKYVQDLKGDSWRGGKIDKTQIERMSEEQIGQLYELMQATKGLDDTPLHGVAPEEKMGREREVEEEEEQRERQNVDALVDRITQKPES